MRIVAVLAGATLILTGCSEAPVPDAVVTPPSTADTSVLVSETVNRYIDITNDIIDGADPGLISAVTTPAWAAEELRGFLALDALGGDAPHARVTRLAIDSLRGKHVLVDAQVAACLGGGDSVTRVTLHLVPRAAELVISEIVPWEDATWCVDSSQE